MESETKRPDEGQTLSLRVTQVSAGPLWCPLSLITDPGEVKCLLSPECPARQSAALRCGLSVHQLAEQWPSTIMIHMHAHKHIHTHTRHTQTRANIILHNISQFNSRSMVFVVGGLHICTQHVTCKRKMFS